MTTPVGTASQAAGRRHFQLFIDGRPTEAASGQRFESVDPFRGVSWATAADGDSRDVDLAVAAARQALAAPWGQLTGFGRARLMRRLAEILARDADELAEVETRDTGKLLREMRGQLAAIPDWFYYFAGLADKLEGTTIPADKPNFLFYTRREPAGVVAAIVPWNSPLLLLCWKLAPALAAGCTVVAKPSDYSAASAVELAGKMAEAGFPPGVLNVVTGFGPAVGQALAAHPGIDKIAFTASTAVGAEVAKAAAGNITGVLLELGGYFVQPTVLTGVTPGMSVASEEVFGPVLAVLPFDTEDEAVALANNSRFGLAWAVWTKDIHRGHRVAHARGPAPSGSTPTGSWDRTFRSAGTA